MKAVLVLQPAINRSSFRPVDSELAPLIIAFDGECLMCSRAIRFVAERDRRDRIRFTRLQDPTGTEMSDAAGTGLLDSMLVRQDERILMQSDAVIAILHTIGGVWRLPAFLGRVIPRSLRDRLYDFVADHRYDWFGTGDACSMPSETLSRRLVP